MADEAELHVGLVVRLDVDLAEIVANPVLFCVMHYVVAADYRDHHVDLLLAEDADLQELEDLVARVGTHTTQIVLADNHGVVTHLGEAQRESRADRARSWVARWQRWGWWRRKR